MAIALTDLVALTGGGGAADRRRPPYFRTKKLAILGCTTSVKYTPWADPTWTIAAHASAWNHCQREPDWWFDLHPPQCFKAKKSWRPKYYEWLQQQQTPIFMQENYLEIPAAVRYPKERILSEFRPYFTNHVAWMIALAMTEGVTHIGLFGCQYKHETEYGVQRESCVYWLGRFEGAGGTIVLPPTHNNLLTTPSKLYGYQSHDAQGKLIPEYYRAPSIHKPGEAESPLRLLGADDRPAHADLGVPVAWDRSPWAEPVAV